MSQTTLIVDFEADGEVLQAYVEDHSPRIMIMGPLASGKTQGSCYKVMNFMKSQVANDEGIRRSRWYAIRNTYPVLNLCINFGSFLNGEIKGYTCCTHLVIKGGHSSRNSLKRPC